MSIAECHQAECHLLSVIMLSVVAPYPGVCFINPLLVNAAVYSASAFVTVSHLHKTGDERTSLFRYNIDY